MCFKDRKTETPKTSYLYTVRPDIFQAFPRSGKKISRKYKVPEKISESLQKCTPLAKHYLQNLIHGISLKLRLNEKNTPDTQLEEPIICNHKISSPKIQTNRRSSKLKSRKSFVPPDNYISGLNQLIHIIMTVVELILFSSLYLPIYCPHILDLLHGGVSCASL